MSESETYYVIAGSTLKGIADVIREQGGTEEDLELPEGFEEAIRALPKVVTDSKNGNGTASLSFTDLPGSPKMFVLYSGYIQASRSYGSTNYDKIVNRVSYNGENVSGTYLYCSINGSSGSSASGIVSAFSSGAVSYTYSEGTLTITATGYKFRSNSTYYLLYIC